MKQNFIITLVGRPNGGKSTIANKLSSTKTSIVSNIEGTTVDYIAHTLKKHPNILIYDTAGYEHPTTFARNLRIIRETNLFFLVLDGKRCTDHKDIDLVRNIYRNSKAPIVGLVNKADCKKKMMENNDYYTLGLKEMIYISAEHDINMKELINRIHQAYEEFVNDNITKENIRENEALLSSPDDLKNYHPNFHDTNIHMKDTKNISRNFKESKDNILDEAPGSNSSITSPEASNKRKPIIPSKIILSLVGKSNTGKSTIFNSLVGYDRALVEDAMCTTIDTLQEEIKIKNHTVFLQDTSGFCTEQKYKYDGTLYEKTLASILNSHVVLIVTDMERGISHKDLELVGLCQKNNIASMLIINKCDDPSMIQDYEPNLHKIETKTHVLYGSCRNNKNALIRAIKDYVAKIITQLNKRISTSVLNQWAKTALGEQVHNQLKVKYMSHVDQFPHEFIINANLPSLYYLKYVERQLIKDFFGAIKIPIKIKIIK